MFAPRGGGSGADRLTPTRVYTNSLISNLTIACPYHNGVNDDDPHAPPVRGRLHRHRGRIEWLPPWASPPG